MSWFSEMITRLVEALSSRELWRQIAALGEAILRSILGGLGSDLQSVANEAVAMAEKQGGSSTQKFEYAFDYVVKTFKDHSFKESVINHAIETGVLVLTAKYPETKWITPLAQNGNPA